MLLYKLYSNGCNRARNGEDSRFDSACTIFSTSSWFIVRPAQSWSRWVWLQLMIQLEDATSLCKLFLRSIPLPSTWQVQGRNCMLSSWSGISFFAPGKRRVCSWSMISIRLAWKRVSSTGSARVHQQRYGQWFDLFTVSERLARIFNSSLMTKPPNIN